MSFKNKLWLLVGVFTAGFVASTLFAFNTLARLKVNGPIYKEIVLQKDLLADILPPPEYLIEAYLVSLQMTAADKAKLPGLIEKAKSLEKDFEDRKDYWAKELGDGPAKSILVDKAYRPGIDMLRLQKNELVPAVQQGDAKAAEVALARLSAKYEEHRAAIDELVKVATAEAAAKEAEAAAAVGRETVAAGILAAVFLVLGILVSLWILRDVMRQLGGDPAEATRIVRGIARGDLSTTVTTAPGDDASLLAAMKVMQEGLRQVIAQIQSSAERLGAAAESLAATARQVADSSSQQSDSASSIAASVEQMTVSINMVSESARSANSLADKARRLSGEGDRHVQDTVGQMNTIAESVASSTDVVRQLGEQSQRISGIVSVIREIADQTNLLALNAAIEAARAGEQGRGFAVVADEVRKLAEKTASSTQEISAMIGEIQSGTEMAVKQMEAGASQVGKGVTVAGATGTAIQDIDAENARVVAAVDEISTALREQAVASNQISQGVERIAQMTEENSAAVVSVAGSANDLLMLAATLKASVDNFRL